MRKKQRHSRSEMFAHIEAFKNSNLPRKIYCKQKGIASSTFHYWARKYREKFSINGASEISTGFIPVKVQSDPGMGQVRIPGQLHFLFPNGIQVMCPESVHPKVLKALLNP